MENPISQNDWHVEVLEKRVQEILGKKVPVTNAVVITNDTVGIRIYYSCKAFVSRVGTFYSQISEYKEQVLTQEEIEKLKKELVARSLPPQKYPLWDYSAEMTEMINTRKQLHNSVQQAYDAIEKCFKAHPMGGLF